MKIKNKGKVFPSAVVNATVDSPNISDGGALSVLNLLPAAILSLALMILSLQDREVLAYMITRSMKITNPNPSPLFIQEEEEEEEATKKTKKKNKKKTKNKQHVHNSSNRKTDRKPPQPPLNNDDSAAAHGSNSHRPLFACDCFDCYTSFWFRWDSSPNRELIHQAIEAFEDHLSRSESLGEATEPDTEDRSCCSGSGRRRPEHFVGSPATASPPPLDLPPEKIDRVSERPAVEEWEAGSPEHETTAIVRAAAGHQKGLARKLLPDVLGLLNSRLWGLWSRSF